MSAGESKPGAQDPASFLQSVLTAVPAFIIRGDAQLRLQYINRVQPGLDAAAVIGSDMLSWVAPDCRDDAKARFLRVLETGEPESFTSAGMGPHGAMSHYECRLTAVVEHGERVGICLCAMDVTEQRRRDEELRENEQKLRIALEASGVGLWSWSLADNRVLWDDRMHEITGCTAPVPLPQYIDRLVHPDDREAVRAAGERILQTGDYIGQPHRLVRPDGEVRWILPTGKVVKAPDGTPERVVGGNVDVTRESSLQEQLRHARRMEAVGNLTAGVAHNFNNMLMAIMPALQLLRDVVPATHTEVLDDAQHAARRGAELVRQLMRFTRRGTRVGRVPRDVASIVKRASTICRRTFDPRIGLIEDIRPDLPAVDCDPGDVEQVLVNLLLNARDAVAECSSPTIVVHARRHDAPTPLGNEHDPRAMWVRIDVQDNGVGIDAAHVERVFEPFFTTKTTGGSGLGLATSYAIAEDHGGWLSMSSTPGDGSTISLFLPGSTARATATGETPVDIRTSAFGRVLLVDDEAIVRRTVSRVLRERGFEVSTAASVEEALHRLGETPAIDVILLDRSMPGTAGDALVPRARQIVPATRVLFFTGQDVEPDAAALVDGVVQKPASTPELVAAIENAIATAREATG